MVIKKPKSLNRERTVFNKCCWDNEMQKIKSDP